MLLQIGIDSKRLQVRRSLYRTRLGTWLPNQVKPEVSPKRFLSLCSNTGNFYFMPRNVHTELWHPFICKILMKSMLPYALGIAKHLLIYTRYCYSYCYSHRHPNPRLLIGYCLCRCYWLCSWNQAVRGSQKSLIVLVCLKAKTSYCHHRTELVVEKLEAERKELDIGTEAEFEVVRREVESSIEVVAKVGRICLYSEVAEKVG